MKSNDRAGNATDCGQLFKIISTYFYCVPQLTWIVYGRFIKRQKEME